MIKNILVLLLILIPYISNSQSLEDIANQASSMGISTQSDVLNELARRGMTEADARRMAAVYGISYDEYMSTYILNTISSEIVSPVVSELTIDTMIVPLEVQEELIEEKTEDILESFNYFGYDIFLNNPFANKEYLVGNIDEGYILAPGDVLRIYVFGDNTYQTEAKIDLNGNILLPDLGMFFASGYTFSSLKNRLNDFLGKSFSGLIDSPKRSFLDVSLTQLRPVKITVLGESNTPGPHLVGGFATVLNSLYASGGIKTNGSLRNIQIFRNNKLIKTIDLYNYITTGSLDGDIRLMNNDIVFIPKRENTVQIRGTINNPSIYELRPGEGIKDILNFSGGLLANSSSFVLVSRIKPISERKKDDKYSRYLTSVDLSSILKTNDLDIISHKVRKGETLLSISKSYNTTISDIKKWNKLFKNTLSINQNLTIKKGDFKLVDGDILTFRPISDRVLNSVSITGSVINPGTYPLNKFSTLKSLINDAAKGLAPRTYMERVDIYKEDMEGNRSFKTFNLDSILSDKVNYMLEDGDEVTIYSIGSVFGEDEITITGFVDDPRTIPFREDLSILDIIFSSVSFEEAEFRSQILDSRIDVRSYNNESGLYQTRTYNLDQILNEEYKIELKPKDVIVLYSKAINFDLIPEITSVGYVNGPGRFTLRDGMIVEDLIVESGGFTKFANRDRVRVYRLNTTDPNISRDKFYVNIDIDYILGLKNKSEVKNPFYLQDSDMLDVNVIIGLRGEYIITVNGEVFNPGTIILSRKFESLNNIIQEFGGFTEWSFLKSSYVTREGEVLAYNLSKDNMNFNYLRTGDVINIASSRGDVTVNGAVFEEKIFNYQKKRKAKYYVKNSGGKIRKTSGKVTITYANGYSKRVGFLRNPIVYPDSEIFVSFRPDKPPLIDRFSDTVNRTLERILMFSTLATTTLTTIFLVKNLKD